MDIKPLGGGVHSGPIAPPAPVPNSTSQTGATQPAAAGTVTVAAAPAQPSLGQVNQAVQKINSALAAQSQGIEFAIDPSSHHIIVKVVDQSNNKVIRQIPSQEALAIADSLDQAGSATQGLLLKQQA